MKSCGDADILLRHGKLSVTYNSNHNGTLNINHHFPTDEIFLSHKSVLLLLK